MTRQSKSKQSEQFGKGKVTPVQIAYMVDQYLFDNQFTKTRITFRSEASSLISKTPLHEGPKGLLSLEMIIDEYVSLKEEKLAVEMKKRMMEQERARVQSLLHGMQNVMNAYNASAAYVGVGSSVPIFPQQSDLNNLSPTGQIVNACPNIGVKRLTPNVSRGTASLKTTQIVDNSLSKKRQASSAVHCAPTNSKKSCNRMPNEQLTDGISIHQPTLLQSSTSGRVDKVSSVQQSSVAQVMFHQTTSAMQTSSGLVTPPKAPSDNSDKNGSPFGKSTSTNSSNKNTPPDFASNCTIVSTKTVIVSPYKQATYYSVEKHCSSTCSPAKSDSQRSSTRDRVKGRLNFYGADETTSLEKSTANESSTSESDDGNFFNLDLPVLDFDISDLLMDFGIYNKDIDASHQQIVSSPAKGLSSIQENTSS